MKQYENTATNTAAPTTEVKEAHTISVDLDSLKPDRERVKSEKTTGMIVGGLAGGLIGGLVGALLGKSKPESKTPVITASAIVGAVVCAIIGKTAKTEEEARSESLMKAARSGNFGEAIKKEMKKREEDAYAIGTAGRGI
jgi:outer membrane lipoprotein SlyB